ncbi:serine-rich adhesin for platelets-like [Xenopus laevis]|uniref:Serine-rich adhesin for platelets-like n=1 Tax=Xenopus laevis TaxID=8355 RepID=A0A8J1LGU6_XENLA|nr:serine-rich adhesin for platelets-like [Xenopus laevis]XP_041428596.1 serine-rich adhesin for platelets-like [Xenopus laevis]
MLSYFSSSLSGCCSSGFTDSASSASSAAGCCISRLTDSASSASSAAGCCISRLTDSASSASSAAGCCISRMTDSASSASSAAGIKEQLYISICLTSVCRCRHEMPHTLAPILKLLYKKRKGCGTRGHLCPNKTVDL